MAIQYNMTYEDFTDVERRTLLLIKCYENVRRENGQFGYMAFKKDVVDPRQHQPFAQFKAVVLWLASKGWGITWKEVNWIGYVKFAFQYSRPAIPFPGQLKNEVILRQYLLSAPERGCDPERSPEEMERIYRQVVDPKIMDDPKASMALGIRRV